MKRAFAIGVVANCILLWCMYAKASEPGVIFGQPANEFDLSGFCWGALHNDDIESAPEGRVGLISTETKESPSLAFLTSTSRAVIGQTGDLTLCKRSRNIFRINAAGAVSNTEIDEQAYENTE